MKIKKQTLKQCIPILVFTIFAVLFTLQSPDSPLSKGRTGIDSSVFRYIAFAMRKGTIPYLQVFDHKGPLIFVIDLVGQAIHFSYGIWVLEFLCIALAMYISYLTIALFTRRSVAFATTLLSYLMLTGFYDQGNMTEEWALPFIAMGLYAFAEYFVKEKVNFLSIALCGFSFGAVCLLRINMIAVWIVGCICVLVYLIRAKRIKNILSVLLPFMLGLIIIVLPFLCYLAFCGALPDFFADYIGFNMQYKNSNLAEKYNSLVFFCKDRGLILAFSAIIFMLIKRTRSCIKNTYILWMLVCSFVLSFYLFVTAGRNYAHYAMVLIPLYVLPIGALLFEINSAIKSHENDLAAILAVCLIVTTCVLPLLRDNCDALFLQYLIPDESDQHIAAMICNETDESDTIAVYGNHCSYYYLSNRMAASKFAYTSIIEEHPDWMTDYVDDLNINKPKLVIMEKGGGELQIPAELQSYLEQSAYSKYYEDSETVIFER